MLILKIVIVSLKFKFNWAPCIWFGNASADINQKGIPTPYPTSPGHRHHHRKLSLCRQTKLQLRISSAERGRRLWPPPRTAPYPARGGSLPAKPTCRAGSRRPRTRGEDWNSRSSRSVVRTRKAGWTRKRIKWKSLALIIQSEVSQEEKKQMYVKACVWTLQRWYWRTFLQGSRGDAEGTGGGGEGGTSPRVTLKKTHYHMWNREPLGTSRPRQGAQIRAVRPPGMGGVGVRRVHEGEACLPTADCRKEHTTVTQLSSN